MCVQETKPGSTDLILWMGCSRLVNTQQIQCPKTFGFTPYNQHLWWQSREGVLNLLHGHCRAWQKQATRWNYDPEETHRQLCDAQGIRHQHYCSILGPDSGHTCLLWPGPALLGLCLLILPQLLFFPLIRLTKWRYIWGDMLDRNTHPYLKHPEVLPRALLQLPGRRGVAEHWGEEPGEIRRYQVRYTERICNFGEQCFPPCLPPLLTVTLSHPGTAVCMTTGWPRTWPRRRGIPH